MALPKLNTDICSEISKFLIIKEYKLLDWIDISELKYYLSLNENAIDLLRKNPDLIYWNLLSSNPNAISLLRENLDKIHWNLLSSNPNAIELLKENQDKINWSYLSRNPNAISLLKENIDKIDWIAPRRATCWWCPRTTRAIPFTCRTCCSSSASFTRPG